ncbi:S1C family serine protease [Nocardioides sp. T2.26MG-1]|uniref:S1C family serine protease n=1 Tax=Nocardioides sp. T2.26MG-1 TaxID=3041166 RepID=UPI0024774492|nr:trypsin-like peptidase domain-containing protein [Nocardioides sp. T2.26MG-1]CAI9401823.1 hypothetical protein HIDPHFAB_00686 [Nocardioides sp. T2.26MG-1]
MDIETPDTAPVADSATPLPPAHRWTWRSTLAGAVAGGVLAASVAVPVTWATLRDDSRDAVAQTTTSATGDDLTDDLTEGSTQLPQPPSWDQLAPGAGDLGTGTDTDAATSTDATADQSRGVVLIETTLTDGAAAGTGLVIDATGLVLTNYHVVEGSTSVTVTLATDGTAYDATVVGFDETADVALLQLDGASGLDVVDLDDDGDPAVSDTVTAVGNAEGQGSLSASTGTVVALEQSITTAATTMSEGEDLTGLIQTDAYVVGGYSGGALLDEEGEVVGITTAASQAGRSESYAVPIEDALDVAEQIEAGDESADVQVGPAAYLGIGVVDTGAGVQVGQVEAGTAAAGAGVEAGDRIVALGGHPVGSLDALRAALATFEPGDRVVLRWTDTAGTSHRATITLGASPVA